MVLRLTFHFPFGYGRGRLNVGEHRYRRLSKNFKWYINLWEGDSFKVVVPFFFECLIYRMTEKGTFWLFRFYNVGNATRGMKLQGAIRTLIETGILKISAYGKSSSLFLNRKTSEKTACQFRKL